MIKNGSVVQLDSVSGKIKFMYSSAMPVLSVPAVRYMFLNPDPPAKDWAGHGIPHGIPGPVPISPQQPVLK